jgi:hypothetical protein
MGKKTDRINKLKKALRDIEYAIMIKNEGNFGFIRLTCPICKNNNDNSIGDFYHAGFCPLHILNEEEDDE